MTHSEIQEQLAKEFNKPKSLIKLVTDNFWIAFKNAIYNPIDSKGKIMIPLLGTFYIKKNSVDRAVIKAHEKKFIKPVLGKSTIDFYEELQTVLKQNERQASKKVLDQ